MDPTTPPKKDNTLSNQNLTSTHDARCILRRRTLQFSIEDILLGQRQAWEHGIQSGATDYPHPIEVVDHEMEDSSSTAMEPQAESLHKAMDNLNLSPGDDVDIAEAPKSPSPDTDYAEYLALTPTDLRSRSPAPEHNPTNDFLVCYCCGNYLPRHLIREHAIRRWESCDFIFDDVVPLFQACINGTLGSFPACLCLCGCGTVYGGQEMVLHIVGMLIAEGKAVESELEAFRG